jgi:hypothetical protein
MAPHSDGVKNLTLVSEQSTVGRTSLLYYKAPYWRLATKVETEKQIRKEERTLCK